MSDRAPVIPAFRFIKFSRDDGVAYIELTRPEKLNAFTASGYAELRSAIRLIELDPAVDIGVIRGSGRAFSVGGDLREIAAHIRSDDRLSAYESEDALPFEAMRRSSKVLIAAVNGVCMAAGVMIVSLCDVAIASASAVFAIPEAKYGLAEGWLPAFLHAKVSLTDLKYLAFTGTTFSAAQACQMRLILEVVEDAQLDERLQSLIAEIRQTTPAARATYKAVFRRLAPAPDPGDMAAGLHDPRSAALIDGLLSRDNG
jgi:enoyl-CoA hydratase/carnithine racemase